MQRSLARLPAVHRVLAEPTLAEAQARLGRAVVRETVRAVLADLRRDTGGDTAPDAPSVAAETVARLAATPTAVYPGVINATGVLIHTNLGRAPRFDGTTPGYLALELDLAAGERGDRLAPIAARLRRYFGAEAATVVTNNAAALVLILAAHAIGREVLVSRGELIEIGGSFRLPEIMRAAGVRLVEVGCTNRTHAGDYEMAIGPETAGILVVHRSNFHLSGFVASAPLDAVVEIGRRHGIPVWVDQGSGCHVDLARLGLRHETTVQEILAAGVDAVLFSGDKLLGGPQAGILVGGTSCIAPLARHPLRRALRPDKATLVALAATLDAFLAERPEAVPLYRLLNVPEIALRRRARAVVATLRRGGVAAAAVPCRAVVGGGTTPDQTLASWAVALAGEDQLAARLRVASPPVVARVEDGRILVDLRAVFPEQDRVLSSVLVGVLATRGGKT
jgi:L-seryl-tRNA(Ser) seleniumtransferase